MRIVFCIYNFVEDKLPLQPWLTINRLAEGLSARGHDIHIVTDVALPAKIVDVELHSVASLRGSNKDEVASLLSALAPDALVYLPTPLSVATASWLDDVRCRKVGFASYSFYTGREIFTALRLLGLKEVKQYFRHLLVPAWVWLRAFKTRQHVVVAQSETTAVRLRSMLKNRVDALCIPPGIDLGCWPINDQESDSSGNVIRLLYLGSAIPIRGFHVALDAMTKVRSPSVKFRVLARGADAEDMGRIQNEIDRRNLGKRVELKGGWIERDELVAEIHRADAVLQPFVLVPSELPVTAMEVIACGTPVIGSSIDGLPSTIGAAGTVTRQGDAGALADAIDALAHNPEIYQAWHTACLKQRESMLEWSDVIDQWEAVLRG